MKYLKMRMKSYGAVIIGLLIGLFIVSLLFEKPDYITGITAAGIGFAVGEGVIFLRYKRKKGVTIMQFSSKDMNDNLALHILDWKYEPPYDFYNNEFSLEALEEILNNNYFPIVNNTDELLGFYCTGQSAIVPAGVEYGAYEDDFIDVGFGMKPELTGKGHGFSFVCFVVDQVQRKYPNIPIRLTVAMFNKRAIHLYEKLGFYKDKVFISRDTMFMTMIKK